VVGARTPILWNGDWGYRKTPQSQSQGLGQTSKTKENPKVLRPRGLNIEYLRKR